MPDIITYVLEKGSPISAAEYDASLHNLDGRVTELENADSDAVGIDHFVVTGNQLTIVLTNAVSHGPFVLPTAQWRWTGPWLPGITYLIGDIVSQDGALYFIRVQHVSPDEFDGSFFTVDGFAYVNILQRAPQPYDVGLGFWNDAVPAGEEVILQNVAVRDYTIPEGFEGSIAFLKVAATATVTLPIAQSSDSLVLEPIAYIVFDTGVDLTSDGGQFGTFVPINSSEGEITITRGDRISVLQAIESESDDTAAGLNVTIAGVI